MYKNIKKEMDYNPFTLIFNDKKREKEYDYFRYIYKGKIIKTFLLSFSIIFAIIFILDFFLLDIESYYLIFSKILVSIIGFVFYLLFNRINYVNRPKYLIGFISIVFISIAMQAILHPGTENTNVFMMGFSLMVYSIYFLLGFKFKDAFVITNIAQLLFYFGLVYVYPDRASFIAYFLLIQANIIFIYSAYNIENLNRQLFYYINRLETENEKQVKLNKILESTTKNIVKEPVKTEIVKKQSVKKKNNILIVDDEQDNILYLEQVAIKLRLNLFKAKNGLDAVNMYKKYQSDIALVLMDIRMPEMNGIEATKEIKKINKDTPVILITAYTEEIIDDNEADLTLSKPITPNDLTKAIKQFIV